jgi:hypothetical protein
MHMTSRPISPKDGTHQPRFSEPAQARIVVLVLVAFLAGIGASALWFSRKTSPPVPPPDDETQAPLGGGTEAALRHLDTPVEIRFYSMLDPKTVPASMTAYSRRVEQLLAKYQRESNGKIKVTRIDSQSYTNLNAAAADGIKPFNADKGDACFLGIAVVRNGQKEAIPYLSPDWEPALESDLTRALERTGGENPQLPPPVPAQPDAGVMEALKRSIPNLDSVSVEEGTKILRASVVDQFNQVTTEMQGKMKDAEQAFVQAQSEADQQSARKQIQQLQAEQTDKFKQVMISSQSQIQALKQLKTAGR